MPRPSATWAALLWTDYNMPLPAPERPGLPRFSSGTRILLAVLGRQSRVSAFAGVDGSSPPIAREGAVELRDHHVVGGNPMRFQRGTIQVREHDAWRNEMGKRDRVVSAAHILPLLVRYGYSVSASRSRR